MTHLRKETSSTKIASFLTPRTNPKNKIERVNRNNQNRKQITCVPTHCAAQLHKQGGMTEATRSNLRSSPCCLRSTIAHFTYFAPTNTQSCRIDESHTSHRQQQHSPFGLFSRNKIKMMQRPTLVFVGWLTFFSSRWGCLFVEGEQTESIIT